jgi:hypothetical protein
MKTILRKIVGVFMYASVIIPQWCSSQEAGLDFAVYAAVAAEYQSIKSNQFQELYGKAPAAFSWKMGLGTTFCFLTYQQRSFNVSGKSIVTNAPIEGKSEASLRQHSVGVRYFLPKGPFALEMKYVWIRLNESITTSPAIPDLAASGSLEDRGLAFAMALEIPVYGSFRFEGEIEYLAPFRNGTIRNGEQMPNLGGFIYGLYFSSFF